MSISLSFNGYNDCSLDDSRLSKMMEPDEAKATHVTLWEKFKDFFRADKKADAYKELYKLIHSTGGGDKLDAFNNLKKLANPECQKLFTKEIYCDEVIFHIDNKKIAQNSLQGLMGLYEQTPLHSMSMPEQRILLEMLDTLREKESLLTDCRPSHIRTMVSNEHCCDLLDLYRPQEKIDDPGAEYKNLESIDYKEHNLLRGLNKGSMKSLSQYSFMGYQKTSSGVEFSMLHPSINFLLNSYSKAESSSVMDLNTSFINGLNKGYQDYNDRKNEIDNVLKKIYHHHGETLNISYQGKNNNKLVNTPFVDMPYISQVDDFADNLNHSLNATFNKWMRI